MSTQRLYFNDHEFHEFHELNELAGKFNDHEFHELNELIFRIFNKVCSQISVIREIRGQENNCK